MNRNDSPLDALIEAEVERALGPAAAVLPPEVLDEARRMLRAGLRYHPGARQLMEQLAEVPVVDRSDHVPTAMFRNLKRRNAGGGR